MKFSASTSLRNTPGSVLPPRSRITTTTLRLPVWCRRSRRSLRSSRRFAGFTYPPKYPPSISARLPSPPIAVWRTSEAICFPELVSQHKRAFVARAHVATEREHGLALDLIGEDRDGEQVGPQRH